MFGLIIDAALVVVWGWIWHSDVKHGEPRKTVWLSEAIFATQIIYIVLEAIRYSQGYSS